MKPVEMIVDHIRLLVFMLKIFITRGGLKIICKDGKFIFYTNGGQ